MNQSLATIVPGPGPAIVSGAPVSAGHGCGWAAQAALATVTEVVRVDRAGLVPPTQPESGRSS